MCDEEVMSLIAEKLGSDLIVIPSSIHETIILKETENVSVTELNAMVEAVNEEAVTPQEKLGNSVYRFDREAQRLEKAVESEDWLLDMFVIVQLVVRKMKIFSQLYQRDIMEV